MEILLRTASTLARACSEAAQRIEVRPTIKLSIHQINPGQAQITERLRTNAETAIANINQVLALQNARSEIRRLIGVANNDVVDRLLAERDCINLSEKYLNSQIDAMAGETETTTRRRMMYGDPATTQPLQHDAAEIAAALGNIRQRLTTVTTGDVTESVDVPTLPKDEIQKLKDRVASLRRRRTALNDELAAANLQRRITLPDSIVAVLRQHQIIE